MPKPAVAKKDTLVEQEAPELIVDRDLHNPRPLDRRIATVALRTPTNNPTDGYDLMVSATFGTERVTLKADEFEIDGNFSLITADIELEFARCTYSLIDSEQGGRTEEWKATTKHKSTNHQKADGSVGAHLSGSVVGSISGNAHTRAQYLASSSSSVTTVRERTQYEWHRLGGNAIQVGPTGEPLDGPVVTDFAGWRVQPSSTSVPSGVVARIKVREEWIKFEDVRFRKTPALYVQRLKNLLTPQQRKRREYFQLLLRHLAQSELREHQDGLHATLAAHVLIVRPFEERAVSLQSPESRRAIAIDSKHVVDFLESEEGHEAGALIALGLRPDIITSVSESAGDKPRPKRGTVFIPDSAPPHAAAAYAQIHRSGSIDRSALIYPNCLHDLRALKLVTVKGDVVSANKSSGVNPETVFRRAVSEMACIKVARGVLRIKPSASQIEVADAVALELGKNWPTEGTKRRNGNAIKRWAIWLEPHLVDPEISGEVAALVAYAMDPKVIKGRPPSLRNSAEPEVKRLLAAGESVAEIARRFKVSPNTIYLWKKKFGL
jgi:hypothetical protein